MDLESINLVITESGMEVEVSCTQRELGSERADMLRRTASIVAQEGIMQSSGCVETGGLLSLFLVVPPFFHWGFSLGSGGGCFLAVSSLVASTTTVQTKIVVKTSLTFLSGKLTVFTQLVGNGG